MQPPENDAIMSTVCEDVRKRASKIKLILMDVDGVLTDGRLYLGNDGNEFKAFHIRDGHGIKMLLEAGVEVGDQFEKKAIGQNHRDPTASFSGQAREETSHNPLIGWFEITE